MVTESLFWCVLSL